MEPAREPARRFSLNLLAVGMLAVGGGCFLPGFRSSSGYAGTTHVRVVGDPGMHISGSYLQDGHRVRFDDRPVPWEITGQRISQIDLTNTSGHDMQLELAYVGEANTRSPRPSANTQMGLNLHRSVRIRVNNGFQVLRQE